VNEVKKVPLKFSYRGLLPFAALNTLFMYQFQALWGEEKKQDTLNEMKKNSRSGIQRVRYWN